MPPDEMMAAPAGANNSSDFVRKLYKMLEDPTYSSVVRWSADGDSFVVLENEKFTKTILPKHFKHSNFASFVRQLNKYDFHKVRHNDENGDSSYGKDAWEFKHPEFRADRKDNLDSIRRKAPAPKRAQQQEEAFPTSQTLYLLNEQLVASQQQIQQLQEQYGQLAEANKILVDEVVSLQRITRTQSQLSKELLEHLNNVDDRRRSSRHSAHSSHSSQQNYHSPAIGMLPDSTDEPPPELRRARDLLNSISPDAVADRNFERLSISYHPQMTQMGSPPDSSTSSVMFTHPNPGPPMTMMQDPVSGDMRHLVYPVGQSTGIDPFHPDHAQSIPYTRPQSNPNAVADAPSQITPPPPKDLNGSMWGPKKPRILLVEDDKTCSRIGSKFLSHVDCSVELAENGSEAVNKVNNEPDRYDLIFMDIIMPIFDGVSATACIRTVAPTVPIIAMTSNIRQEDIATYFHWGMNDILAKPFTKDGMVRALTKNLPHMLRNPPPPGTADTLGLSGAMAGGHEAMVHGPYPGAPLPSPHPVGGPGGSAVKFESTPIQSPSTTASWHSPSQITHTSPNTEGNSYMTAPGSGPGLVMTPGGLTPGGLTPGGSQRQQHHFAAAMVPQMTNPGLSRMADPTGHGDDRPEKRPRLYAPGQPSAYH